jgi:flagellin
MAMASLGGLESGTLGGLRQMGALALQARRHTGRLSSGLQVGGNGDAELASLIGISQRLDVQAQSLNMAAGNVVQGASLLQTAQGGLSQAGDLLSRARELAVQAANGTLSNQDRAGLDAELTQVKQELDRTANATQFNGQPLLNGTSGPVAIQAGANPGETVGLNLPNTTTAALGLTNASLATQSGAQAAIDQIDTALQNVNGAQSQLAAQQHALDATAQRIGVTAENTAAGASRIQDADVAAEASGQIRTRLQQQFALAALAHGNVNATAALRLLGFPG